VAATFKRGRFLISLALIGGTLLVSAAVLLYLLTRSVEIEFAQDPNPLEAHEANRKIKLLNEAREAKRRGFVRLSEVEINSFLDESYNNPKKNLRTNAPVHLVKTAVLLHHTNLTVVTWMAAPMLGIELPFVWQRTVIPRKSGEKWTFELSEMQLGKLHIPEAIWSKVNSLFGGADGVFQERKNWLANLPNISLVKNESSLSPELRLYSYQPSEKGGL
jgi:hypothetical protein